MKIITRTTTIKGLFTAFILSLSLSFGLVQAVSATAQGSLSLSSASTGYGEGSNIALTVSEDSNTVPVNAIEADLNYDNTKLQYVGVDASTSAFPVPGPVLTSANTVKIARGIAATSVIGKHIVAVVNFKTIANSGTTDISFVNSSAIVEKDNNANLWDNNTAGLTITLNSQPPTSEVTSSSSSPENLIAVKVVNSEGIPVTGAQVTLNGGKTATTDSSGVASFTGVSSGSQKVTVVYQGKTSTSVATVKSLNSQQVQQITFRLAALNTKTSTTKTAILAALLIIMLIAAAIWFSKIFHHSSTNTPENNQPTATNDNKQA